MTIFLYLLAYYVTSRVILGLTMGFLDIESSRCMCKNGKECMELDCPLQWGAVYVPVVGEILLLVYIPQYIGRGTKKAVEGFTYRTSKSDAKFLDDKTGRLTDPSTKSNLDKVGLRRGGIAPDETY